MFSWFYKKANEVKVNEVKVNETNDKELESILHQPIITIDDWSHEIIINMDKNRDITQRHEKLEKDKIEERVYQDKARVNQEKEKLEKERIEKEKERIDRIFKLEVLARIELKKMERDALEREKMERYKMEREPRYKMDCIDKLLEHIHLCIGKIVWYLSKV